jgi:hypothetical protein
MLEEGALYIACNRNWIAKKKTKCWKCCFFFNIDPTWRWIDLKNRNIYIQFTKIKVVSSTKRWHWWNWFFYNTYPIKTQFYFSTIKKTKIFKNLKLWCLVNYHQELRVYVLFLLQSSDVLLLPVLSLSTPRLPLSKFCNAYSL